MFQNVAQCGTGDNTVLQCVLCFGQSSTTDSPSMICPQIYSTCLANNFEVLHDMQPDDYNISGTIDGTTVTCFIQDGTECGYYYFAGISLAGEMVYAVEERQCLLVPLWGIVVIILMSLIAIGVGIIGLAKLTLLYLDYREVHLFKKELLTASFSKCDNPMYQPPTVTYRNVAYGL